LIDKIVKGQGLPVNVMIFAGSLLTPQLAEIGVARMSWGNLPYVDSMAALAGAARPVLRHA